MKHTSNFPGGRLEAIPADTLRPLQLGDPSLAGSAICACTICGAPVSPQDNVAIKRGAVFVSFDPIVVTWKGKLVPLSPTEASVFGRVALRGKATFAEIDETLRTIGRSVPTRALIVMRIRRKFLALGACDPLLKIGSTGVRLSVDDDDNNSNSTIIGIRY